MFASVITGNLVVLGLGAARGDGRLALFAGCALAAYSLGVILGAPRRRERDRGGDAGERVWPREATAVLALEAVLLVAFAVCWETFGSAAVVARGSQLALLALAAAAMGIQSTAVRRFGQVSTTYLTSTLTGVLESVVAGTWSPELTRSVTIITVALAGAAAGAGLLDVAPRLLPALQLAPLLAVIALARLLPG